jgi:hypothetical protein
MDNELEMFLTEMVIVLIGILSRMMFGWFEED